MSSGNGDGAGFFSNLLNVESFSGGGNFFENLFVDGLNAAVQMATLGYAGYEDGKISNGINTNIAKKVGREVVSGVKEVTGAKAAEEANRLAREQFEEQKAAALLEREQAKQRNANEQIAASRAAGAARNAGRSNRTGNNQTTGSFSLGQDERDFLGL